jgi:hypothetical protein
MERDRVTIMSPQQTRDHLDRIAEFGHLPESLYLMVENLEGHDFRLRPYVKAKAREIALISPDVKNLFGLEPVARKELKGVQDIGGTDPLGEELFNLGSQLGYT